MLHELFQIQTWAIFGVWVAMGFLGHVLDQISAVIGGVTWCKLDNQRSFLMMIFGGPCYLAAAFLSMLTSGLRRMWDEDLSDECRWQLPGPEQSTKE